MAIIQIDTEILRSVITNNAEMIVGKYTKANPSYKKTFSIKKDLGMIIIPIGNAPYKDFEMDFQKNKESIDKFFDFVISKIQVGNK